MFSYCEEASMSNEKTPPAGAPPEEHEKTANLLESLKVDETIEKIRSQLSTMNLLDVLDKSLVLFSSPWLQIALKLLFQFDVSGASNIPKEGGAIIVMNHQTDLDPFFLNLGINKKVYWFVKQKNVNIPVVKSLVPAFGIIPMKDDMSETDAAMKIIEYLKAGQMVGLFPEGKPTEDGSLHKFHRFPARFCLELKVPYIPVAIVGGIEAYPPHSKLWSPKLGKKIELRIGAPVTLDPKLKQTPEVALKVAEEMQADVQKLLDQA
jgi:1-acyl-sn-glycerol-3-phosphate acyltransferase